MIFLFDENDIVKTKDDILGLITRSAIYDPANVYKVDIKGRFGWYLQYLQEKELAIHIKHEGRSKEEMRDLLLIISKLS